MFSEIGDVYFLLFFNTKSYKQKTISQVITTGGGVSGYCKV